MARRPKTARKPKTTADVKAAADRAEARSKTLCFESKVLHGRVEVPKQAAKAGMSPSRTRRGLDVIVSVSAAIQKATDETQKRMAKRALKAIETAQSRLPATYMQAVAAIAECERLDECAEWANKAEALASYAAQAKDDSLRLLADRIQARAVRRMGELLQQFDARGGDQSKSEGVHTFAEPSRQEMADRAGLSKHQQVQAVRVANVPEEKFEAAVETPKPATVTQLAEMGKQTRPRLPPDETVAYLKELRDELRRRKKFCQANPPTMIAQYVPAHEAAVHGGHIFVLIDDHHGHEAQIVLGHADEMIGRSCCVA